MSDRECHADRICHEGRCRFVEEVRKELETRDQCGLRLVLGADDADDFI